MRANSKAATEEVVRSYLDEVVQEVPERVPDWSVVVVVKDVIEGKDKIQQIN